MRPENSNDTVSEGIGYGMLIGVYMNDQPMFDKLWAYAQGALRRQRAHDLEHQLERRR